MAKGREYAEKLVGPLDRSFYSKQSDVAEKTIQTNWDDIQNQYKNLQEKLKREQEIANRNFAEGLVGVSEGSNARMSAATDNLARSGLIASGMKDIIRQNDTITKGAEVLDLLEKTGDVNVALAENLSEANKTAVEKQNELSGKLADTLGDIGAADTATQMAYNKGLAEIGEAMEAREANNALEKAKREAEAQARSYSTKEQDDELEEFYRRRAIISILNGVNPEDGSSLDLDDNKKAMILSVMYDIGNSKDVIDAYNTNLERGRIAENYDEEYKKALENKQKVGSQDTFENYKEKVVLNSDANYLFLDGLMSTTNDDGLKVYSEDDSMNLDEDRYTLIAYLKGWKGYSEEDAQKALKRLVKTGKINHPYAVDGSTVFTTEGSMRSKIAEHPEQVTVKLSELKKLYNEYGGSKTSTVDYDNLVDFTANRDFQEGTIEANKEFNKVREIGVKGLTYEDLAELLYGSR